MNPVIFVLSIPPEAALLMADAVVKNFALEGSFHVTALIHHIGL
jgi:hypothetical protein